MNLPEKTNDMIPALHPILAEVTVAQVAAIVGTVSAVGSGVIWMLGREFVSKKEIDALKAEIDNRMAAGDSSSAKAIKEAVDAMTKAIDTVKADTRQQAIAIVPLDDLRADVRHIREMLETRLREQDHQLANHGERLAALEASQQRSL